MADVLRILIGECPPAQHHAANQRCSVGRMPRRRRSTGRSADNNMHRRMRRSNCTVGASSAPCSQHATTNEALLLDSVNMHIGTRRTFWIEGTSSAHCKLILYALDESGDRAGRRSKQQLFQMHRRFFTTFFLRSRVFQTICWLRVLGFGFWVLGFGLRV